MARGKQTLVQRITLEGGEEVRRGLKAIGDDGKAALESLNKSAARYQGAGTRLNRALLETRQRVGDLTTRVGALGQRFSGLARTVGTVGATIAAAFSVRALIDMTSQWTDLTSMVRLAVDEHEDVGNVMERLQKIARRTYSDLNLTVDQFARNARILNDLNIPLEKQLDFQEGINNALVVSAARGEQAARVQDAIGKAMSLGALRGEEFNAVMERGGRIAELLAEELGVTIGELRGLAEQGLITGDVLLNTVTKNMETLRREAESMPATIQDGFILIRNALLAYIGTADQANGVSARIAEGLIWVADNIGIVITAVGLLVGAFLAVKTVGLAVELYGIVKALAVLLIALGKVGIALLANPITLWTLAITAAAIALLAITGNLGNFVKAVKDTFAPLIGFADMGEQAAETVTKALGMTGSQLEDISYTKVPEASKALEGLNDKGNALTQTMEKMGEVGNGAFTEIGRGVYKLTNNMDGLLMKLRYNEKQADRLYDSLKQIGGSSGSVEILEGGGGDSIVQLAGGGHVRGRGTGTSDSIPARLSNGEFVVRAAAVRKYGTRFLAAINSMRTPGFASGGLVSAVSSDLVPPSRGSGIAAAHAGQPQSLRPMNLTIAGETFEGLLAPESVAEKFYKYATGRQLKRAGRTPSWYGAGVNANG